MKVLHQNVGNKCIVASLTVCRSLLKGPYYAFLSCPFPVVCFEVLSAGKMSAKAKI